MLHKLNMFLLCSRLVHPKKSFHVHQSVGKIVRSKHFATQAQTLGLYEKARSLVQSSMIYHYILFLNITFTKENPQLLLQLLWNKRLHTVLLLAEVFLSTVICHYLVASCRIFIPSNRKQIFAN